VPEDPDRLRAWEIFPGLYPLSNLNIQEPMIPSCQLSSQIQACSESNDTAILENPDRADCEFEGCDKRNLPDPKYFPCEYCYGYFCGDHRHTFKYDCPGYDKWKNQRPSSNPVTGVFRKNGELTVITDPQEKIPRRKDRENPPGYQ
jgi:hypothetical protein